MFFKRKERNYMSSWGHVHKLQRRYARRLADWLNRKVAVVPVKKMRIYLVSALIGMAMLNGAIAVHIIRYRWHWSLPAEPFEVHWRVSPPVIPRGFDEKLYDSLKKQRPGLADSLKILEGIY
jgi:hypothetical protein